ncbi:hypothetical protein ACN38_g9412 [Penicillium nordicum]|uniref:Uncharacterized protein n=1 Tax=Penicillium nordicum TaxID=229535 RepID=A0A0M8P366_9EURO|nr:hypothetical protein ACN38_g9412 [Penicillium nordicum]
MPEHNPDTPRDIRSTPNITPRKIKRSRLLALSPEQEMKRARFLVHSEYITQGSGAYNNSEFIFNSYSIQIQFRFSSGRRDINIIKRQVLSCAVAPGQSKISKIIFDQPTGNLHTSGFQRGWPIISKIGWSEARYVEFGLVKLSEELSLVFVRESRINLTTLG